MPDSYNYPAHVHPAHVERDADGRYVVTIPDFGWGATDGTTLEEALIEARDLLRELIPATMRAGNDLPTPCRATGRQPTIAPPLPIAQGGALQGVPQRRCVATQRRVNAYHLGSCMKQVPRRRQ